MEEISAKTQMAKVRSFEKGFMATHLINIGAELGLFEALNEKKEGMTVSELVAKCNLHEPYLRIWCQTAYHFEILDADDHGRFRLQPFLDEILGDKTHFRNYLANIYMDVRIGESIELFMEAFRTGKPVNSYDTPEFSKMAYEPTKNMPMAFLYMILPKFEHLKHNLEKGVRFLDIGCGNGNLIIQLAVAFEKSTFVGIGPDVYGIESAKATISQLGLGDRVAVECMGGGGIPYEDEFHMATMVLTLHEIPPAVRQEAVKKSTPGIEKGRATPHP